VSDVSLQTGMVGNELITPQYAFRLRPAAVPLPAGVLPMVIPVELMAHEEEIPVTVMTQRRRNPFKAVWELAHRYSIAAFALLFLITGAAGIEVAGRYLSASTVQAAPATSQKIVHPAIAGLNLTVPAAQLDSRLQQITSQPATVTVGGQPVAIPADTIKSWLKVTSSHDKSEYYIRVQAGVMAQSLADMAGKFAHDPVNQVTVSHNGVDRVVVGGRDGVKLSDPDNLRAQAVVSAKTVMDGSGLNFNAPTEAVPFAAVTPAAFDKLIEVDLTSKQMWTYQNGQLLQTYAVSAGAPATPTPVGQYKIYAKYATQDMSGYNADGSRYFQPHVHWVNYFLPGGYAVHGVYWHPSDWFGNINSSHGCVGVMDAQAKQIYDWAPIGTTVITYR
jgi:lipoprotein-anchoring transpeptidase ErfK/SrfK